MSLDIVITSSV